MCVWIGFVDSASLGGQRGRWTWIPAGPAMRWTQAGESYVRPCSEVAIAVGGAAGDLHILVSGHLPFDEWHERRGASLQRVATVALTCLKRLVLLRSWLGQAPGTANSGSAIEKKLASFYAPPTEMIPVHASTCMGGSRLAVNPTLRIWSSQGAFKPINPDSQQPSAQLTLKFLAPLS